MQVFPEWLGNMHPPFPSNLDLPMCIPKSELIAPACVKEKHPNNANHNDEKSTEAGPGNRLTRCTMVACI